MSREVTNLLYLVTIVTFILALRFLSNPATARRGNQIGAAGMLVAIVVTFLQKSIDSYWEIVLGMIVGGTFGAVAARKVRILYGGSVKADNVQEYVELPLCDGCLVGGASLDAAEFSHIVKVTAEVYGHR